MILSLLFLLSESYSSVRYCSYTATRMEFHDSSLLVSGSKLPPHTFTPNQHMQLELSPRFRHFFLSKHNLLYQACHCKAGTTCLRTNRDTVLALSVAYEGFLIPKGVCGVSGYVAVFLWALIVVTSSSLPHLAAMLSLGRDT